MKEDSSEVLVNENISITAEQGKAEGTGDPKGHRKKTAGNKAGLRVLKLSRSEDYDEASVGDSRLLSSKDETDMFKLAEARIRKKTITALQVILWVTLAADLLILWVRNISGTIPEKEIFPYFMLRILVQFAINFFIYAVVVYATEYSKYKSCVKNSICAVAVCTMAGVIGVFHSSSPACWVASGIGLMFSSVFRNNKLLKYCLIDCVIMTALACAFVLVYSGEESAVLVECLRNLAISELIIGIVFILSRFMLIHQTQIMDMTLDFHKKQQEYRKQSETDNLTGVYSRYYFMAEGEQLLKVCSSANPVSVCMLDIDDFKHVNDTYGHENGDVVLRELGRILQSFMDKPGEEHVTAGRYGGEEFVILFSGGNAVKHHKCIEEIRRQFSDLQFSFMKEKITLSGGIVTCVSKQDDLLKVLKVSDDALYESKHNGKNKITVGRI
ncbi:MAG: GGDEF domain-containing protein [Lachnospiraceae bacterium]|nr:GGDEF domain-containing protein [Lachnospiraceae bacterium]